MRPTDQEMANRLITLDDLARISGGARHVLERRMSLRLEDEAKALLTWAEAKRLLASAQAGETSTAGPTADQLVVRQLEAIAETRPPTPRLRKLFALLADAERE